MASENIIDRLATRLNLATSNNREMPDMGTRSLGGSFRKNHPYISGYFYATFVLPQQLFKEATEISSKWLSSTCESFTPPSETINYVEVPGLGQVKARFYSSRTVTNDVSFAFREYQNLPVMNVLNQWTKTKSI